MFSFLFIVFIVCVMFMVEWVGVDLNSKCLRKCVVLVIVVFLLCDLMLIYILIDVECIVGRNLVIICSLFGRVVCCGVSVVVGLVGDCCGIGSGGGVVFVGD